MYAQPPQYASAQGAAYGAPQQPAAPRCGVPPRCEGFCRGKRAAVSRRRTLTPRRSGDEGWKARLQLPPRDERFRTEARGAGEAV